MTSVGFLGPEGTFTHAALRQLVPHLSDRAQACATQQEAVRLLERGVVDRVVLPFDNTVNGVVAPTLDTIFLASDVVIEDSLVLPVTFNAFRLAGDTSPVKYISSHPHALAQCHKFVNAVGAEIRTSTSTAQAVRDLEPGGVAVAAAQAGSELGLRVVKEAVEDLPGALTQFVLLGKEAPNRTDPVLVLGGVPRTNRPGTLAAILARVADHGQDLLNVVTKRVPRSADEFYFMLFVDTGGGGAIEAADAWGLSKFFQELRVYGSVGKFDAS